jgi:hypothetical protein
MTVLDKAAAVKQGDLFRCSWGYDQTNVDFYQVVDVSPSGATIKVRAVRQDVVSASEGGHERVAPVKGAWLDEEVLTKRWRLDYHGKPAFRVASYASAYLWDGVPAYQTAQGWGH